MEEDVATDERLRSYLLAELDEAGRERIEAAYFADDAVFERLGVVEDDLIDAYAADALDMVEREKFERAFLTTNERRERVAFARAWKATMDSSRAQAAAAAASMGTRSSWARRPGRSGLLGWLRAGPGVPRWGLAAPAAACIAGGLWIGLERTRMTGAIERLEAERNRLTGQARELQQQVDAERRRAEALQASRPASPPTGTASLVAAFVLMSGQVRGATGGTVIPIAPETVLLRVRLELETNSHQRYQPALQTVDGEEIWRQRAVPADAAGGAASVTVELPATLLTSRAYILTLSGVTAGGGAEEIAAYTFRVVRP